MTKLNLDAVQLSSLTQPFFNNGSDINLSIPMAPGTVAASGTYSNSVSVTLDRQTTVQIQVQMNFSDNLWYITASYNSQALPDWGAATQKQELDFIGTMNGNTFTATAKYFNLSASPITVAPFNVNIILKKFLTPFQT